MFSIDGDLIKGSFTSKTAKKMIKTWASLNKEALEKNWELAKSHSLLNKIKPLD